MSALDDNSIKLADCLNQLLKNYDMEEIGKILEKVEAIKER